MATTIYGSASNGMVYGGQTVGSGYDCTVRRESETTALANVTRVGGDRADYLAVFDIDADTDLQALAVRIARNPMLRDGEWASDDGDHVDPYEGAWADLAARWNALSARTEGA